MTSVHQLGSLKVGGRGGTRKTTLATLLTNGASGKHTAEQPLRLGGAQRVEN